MVSPEGSSYLINRVCLICNLLNIKLMLYPAHVCHPCDGLGRRRKLISLKCCFMLQKLSWVLAWLATWLVCRLDLTLQCVNYTVPRHVFYRACVLGDFLQVGKEAETHVWDANSMRTVSVLKGFHRRGIICVDFSGTQYKRM